MDSADQSFKFRNFLRHDRSILLLGALIAAAIASTAGFMIWHGRRDALNEHQSSMNSMGIVLAEQTSRHAQMIDLLMQDVQARIAKLNITTPAEFVQRLSTSEVHQALADRIKNVPQATALALIDANGQGINFSLSWPTPRIDLSDRDYYSHFRDHNDPDLFVGALSIGRSSGKLSLFFVRRINGPGGVFCGLLLGLVDFNSLSAFYQTAGEHLQQRVTLLRRDGAILLTYPQPETAIGKSVPEGSPWYRLVAQGGGEFAADGFLEHAPSLLSVHPLPGYPLVVDIVMKTSDVYAKWHTQALYTAFIAVVATFTFAGLLLVLARQVRRQAEQNGVLEESSSHLREGRERLRSYAEMSADWFWEQDEDLRFTAGHPENFIGACDGVGKTRWDLADGAMTEDRWAPHKADLAARRPFRNFRWELIDPKGIRHFIDVSGDPIFDRNGLFTGYRGTGRDITEEVRFTARLAFANNKLELGRQQFDAVLSNISQGICFFDGDRRLLLWNRRYAEIYQLLPEAIHVGWPLDEIMSYRAAARTAPDLPIGDYLAWGERAAAEMQVLGRIVTLQNGRIISINHNPLRNGGWVGTHEDITERQQAEADIVFMARHDVLTRLPNRMLFRERVEQAIAAAARGSPFAVLCLDLDNFKQVNDTLGHPVGDALLVAAADRLRACVRDVDTVARLGGDEFGIIQSSIDQPDDAEVLASRIIAAFREPFEVGEHKVNSALSIGINIASAEGVTYETLMRDVAIALFLAKTEERGTARFFEPEMDARIQQRRILELDLRGAIARSEFEVYYQPKIDLRSDKVVGFEALVRWHHPTRGFVSPADFIPAAEDTGMIVAIGEWVLRAACFEAENWPADVDVAVNLSPVQFRQGDLVGTVEAALAASGLRPDRLELEITESVFLHNSTDTLTALRRFREMGICISLDDFGTGYSSLSYLRSFPFSKIKIDQSFVQDLLKNRESMSIVKAVVGLGQTLGIKTTAEGVETHEQLETLRNEGCDEVQGYFFSRPQPAGEVLGLIERINLLGADRTPVNV